MIKQLILVLTISIVLQGCPNQNNCMECEPAEDKTPAQCKQCYQGYIDDKFNCVTNLAAAVENCVRYEYKSFGKLKVPVCQNCEAGFFVVNDKCRKCKVEGCAICETEITCSACSNGRALDLEKEPVCLKTACEIRNCDLCLYGKEKQISCMRCMSESVRLRGNNKECLKSRIQNCAEIVNVDEEICKVCAEGFYLDKDYSCIKNQFPGHGSVPWYVWLLLLLVLSGVPVFFYERHFGNVEKKQKEALLN